MRTLSKTAKDFITANSIKDSGVITWEEYHNEDDTLRVTNINLGGPGFDADRIYTLTNKGRKILTSNSASDILDKYTDLMMVKYDTELNSLYKIDHVTKRNSIPKSERP